MAPLYYKYDTYLCTMNTVFRWCTLALVLLYSVASASLTCGEVRVVYNDADCCGGPDSETCLDTITKDAYNAMVQRIESLEVQLNSTKRFTEEEFLKLQGLLNMTSIDE